MSFNFIIEALMPDLDTYWHPNPPELCISCGFGDYFGITGTLFFLFTRW